MAASDRSRPPAPREDWFSRLFGFAETNYEEVSKWLRVIPPDAAPGEPVVIESLANRELLGAGAFSTPSLAELRKQGAPVNVPGRISVTNELGDVAAKHALPENRYATFQVASQFNCLEFVGPSIVPEDGITGYASDRTQGPACSIACGPATAFRNYFARVHGSSTPGQTRQRQIDNLADMSRLLGNVPNGKLYQVKGGYTLADDRQLRQLNEVLRSFEAAGRMDEARAALRVGVHSDVQVTSTDWGRRRVVDSAQTVTQVFGSACSVAYSRGGADKWQGFASLVLEASYEATLWAALLNADRHRCEAGSRRVFLTCLGGGAFGNPMDWITHAMRRAIERFENQGLDIRIVTYAGAIHPDLRALERDFSASRPQKPPAAAAAPPWREAEVPPPQAQARAATETNGHPAATRSPANGPARGTKRKAEDLAPTTTPEKVQSPTAAFAKPLVGVHEGACSTPKGAGSAAGGKAGASASATAAPAAAAVPEAVLAEAQRLGHGGLLRRLLGLPEVARRGVSAADALAALQANGGLFHPAKRALVEATAVQPKVATLLGLAE